MRLEIRRMRKQRGDCILIQIEESGFFGNAEATARKRIFPFPSGSIFIACYY